ncbi:cytochrome P450 2J2-like [Denticeps clupeoides]|uniref:Uncharacterized protein n=1 Tax=Denticeps clupeoides TaxID=299321 RepID=A0AAY4DFV3_9TELE|nr:cytochrome P450 2J2-like [Denticeps clupeoides]
MNKLSEGSTMLWASLLICDAKSCLLFLFLFFMILVLLMRRRNSSNFPPGPWWISSWGKISVVLDHHAIGKMSEKYGRIFSLRGLSDKAVCVSGYKLVSDVLVTQGEHFVDCHVSALDNHIFQGHGIFRSNGYKWRRQRQFLIGQIKNCVYGKRTLELHIQQECASLCEAMQAEGGRPFNPHAVVINAAANVIATLAFGKRFDYDCSDFQSFLKLRARTALLKADPLVQLYSEFLRLMRRKSGQHMTILNNYTKLAAFVKKQIEKHKEDWDPFHHRDFIDSYIGEIDKRRKDTEAGFTVDNLVYCILDLFEAGTETITSTLLWALLFMIKYPGVQRKVHSEIDRVIGNSRPPCPSDRLNMPYTNAVLHETLRAGRVLPSNRPRLTSIDATVGGHLIPEGTLMFAHLSSVLNDKSEWETPDHFNPKHFLDDLGSFHQREAFFPFSAGRRACLGESLAWMELFLFFTSLLQKFTFAPRDGAELSLEAQGKDILSPAPFQLRISPQ